MPHDRALTEAEIETMTKAGCTAEDWTQIQVGDGFDPSRVRQVQFVGQNRIGSLAGTVSVGGVDLPCAIADATLVNCELCDGVRVTQVRSHMAHYKIGAGAVVTDVGELTTRPGATFGNGVEIEPVNEGGGREIRLFNGLSSQIAYLLCVHRYRSDLIEKLNAMVDAAVAEAQSDRGEIGAGAVVAHVGELVDVNVGPNAEVVGAASLKNGTILSEAAAPTRVGAGVVAEDFILAEGASVDGGAVLSHTFVGQGCQMGKQFSAENTVLFANSEAFHGEACSLFAGPYTVTHHKSTLLIAGLFSFYNAGSGTNQSNHMYKLGPLHQGVVERGSKTGSFSYMMWPCAVGPFSVVIGKHSANFDTRDLPFSYITDEKGESMLTPTMNLSTVGTVRDGAKWPNRDRRTATVKRDQIRFEVFSPFVVGKMMRGEALLTDLYKNTPKDDDRVRYQGVMIKRLVLRYGAKGYASATDLYLNGKVLERATPAMDQGQDAVRAALVDCGIYSETWADVGGLLMGVERLKQIESDALSGKIQTVADLLAAFGAASDAYPEDEWAWIRRAFASRNGTSVDDLTMDDLGAMQTAYQKAKSTSIKKVLADAEIEFDESARIAYGLDGDADDAAADFESVRGSYASNSFVKQMQEDLEG